MTLRRAVQPTSRLRVRSGPDRSLDVLTAGPPGRIALVFHSGTPSAAVAYPPMVRAAEATGLSFVTWSRPGYATSTPQPGRTVADLIADTAAVLDAIGADTFLTIGWSGGGPYALACATLLPERCLGAATLAGLAPYGAEGLDWVEGMGPENIAGYSAAMAGEAQLETLLNIVAPAMAEGGADDFVRVLGGIFSEIDKAAVTGEFAEFMAAMNHRALSTGIAGWRDDILASVHNWGFDPAENTTPVMVWHGEQDRMVPFSHGRWLSEHLPGAIPRLFPDQGHLTLAVEHVDEIVRELGAFAGG